jgi:hypothetical protein
MTFFKVSLRFLFAIVKDAVRLVAFFYDREQAEPCSLDFADLCSLAGFFINKHGFPLLTMGC